MSYLRKNLIAIGGLLMKKLFFIFITIFVIAGCSLEEQAQKDITINKGNEPAKEQVRKVKNNPEDPIEKYLKEHGLPLTGVNVFDPKTIAVGNRVGEMELTEKACIPLQNNTH